MTRIPGLIIQHLFWKGCYYGSLLGVNVIISRLLGAGESGHIFYTINNLSLLLLVLSGSLESGATFYTANKAIDAGRIARYCFWWAISATAIFLLGTFLIRSIPATEGIMSATTFSAAALFVPGILFTSFFTSLFYARRNFVTPNLILLLINLGWIAALLLAGNGPFIRAHFMLLYFSLFFLQGIAIVTAFFLTSPAADPTAPFTAAQRKMLLQYSGHALIANGLFFLVTRIDYWFVERYCTPTDLGNYIQASKLIQLLLLIPSTIAATLFPLIAASGVNLRQQLKVITRMVMGFTLVAAALLAIPGHWLFPQVFGNSFQEMHSLFLLLIPGLLALAAHYPITAYFSGNNRIRVNITGAFIAAIVITLLDILLLPGLGVRAAAWISSAGYISYLLYLLASVEKEQRGSAIGFFKFARGDWQWLRQWLVKRPGT